MTLDAKIGLSLGLVFIFIIAFVINGLPFIDPPGGNEQTTKSTAPENYTPGIAGSTRDRARELYRKRSPSITIYPPAQNIAKESVIITPPAVGPPAPVIEIPPAIVKKVEKPKLYTVKSGDSLSVISQKFYGSGNVQTGMKIISKASKLKSYDDIYVGQKLAIPTINQTENLTQRIVEAIIPGTSRNHSVYIIAEGDSLWSIATEKFGDGVRHNEIAKLNNLTDADLIKAGMKLKIPAY